MSDEPSSNGGNGSNRLTWAIVGAGACSLVVVLCLQLASYLLDRMDRMFERLSSNERMTHYLQGFIDGQESMKGNTP